MSSEEIKGFIFLLRLRQLLHLEFKIVSLQSSEHQVDTAALQCWSSGLLSSCITYCIFEDVSSGYISLMLRRLLATNVYSWEKQCYFCFITGLWIWLHIDISPTKDRLLSVVMGGLSIFTGIGMTINFQGHSMSVVFCRA